MCIASFVFNSEECIFTFNRDEDPKREFSQPIFNREFNLFYPLDLVSGGTWIGCNMSQIACLQNGAESKHQRELPYTKSRGLILLDLLKKHEILSWFNNLENEKIEPFTIHVLDLKKLSLMSYVYNGFTLQANPNPLGQNTIKCSSTLYDSKAKDMIKQAFEDERELTALGMLQFHRDFSIGGTRNTFIKRPATSSITQFVVRPNEISCRFENIINQSSEVYHLK